MAPSCDLGSASHSSARGTQRGRETPRRGRCSRPPLLPGAPFSDAGAGCTQRPEAVAHSTCRALLRAVRSRVRPSPVHDTQEPLLTSWSLSAQPPAARPPCPPGSASEHSSLPGRPEPRRTPELREPPSRACSSGPSIPCLCRGHLKLARAPVPFQPGGGPVSRRILPRGFWVQPIPDLPAISPPS